MLQRAVSDTLQNNDIHLSLRIHDRRLVRIRLSINFVFSTDLSRLAAVRPEILVSGEALNISLEVEAQWLNMMGWMTGLSRKTLSQVWESHHRVSIISGKIPDSTHWNHSALEDLRVTRRKKKAATRRHSCGARPTTLIILAQRICRCTSSVERRKCLRRLWRVWYQGHFL